MQFKEKVPGGQETTQKVGAEAMQCGEMFIFWKMLMFNIAVDAGHAREDECAGVHWSQPDIQVVLRIVIKFICQRMRAKFKNIRTTEYNLVAARTGLCY